jgi:hypothetical protein
MGEARIRKRYGHYDQQKLACRMVIGARMSEEYLPEDLKEMARDGQAMALVYEIEYEHKKYYCCVAGGKMVDGEPRLTPIGMATVYAMLSLPIGYSKVIIQEMHEGKTPLLAKVQNTLRGAPERSAIAFFGDAQGYLDGGWVKCLNILGSVSIEEILRGQSVVH